MGNHAIFKDSSGRIGGYVISEGNEIVCRANLNEPAQLLMLFSDGTSAIHAIRGNTEQRFESNGKQMIGCCVLRQEKILLLTDESLRCAVYAQLPLRSSGHGHESGRNHDADQGRNEKRLIMDSAEKQRSLPQRRWPPPPCWHLACYRDGIWQEDEN